MTILVVGDSFSVDPSLTVWPTLLGQRLGLPVINRAASGTGYAARASSGPPNRFLRQLSMPLPTTDVRLVIVMGSPNDRHFYDQHLRGMYLTTHLEMRRLYPQARHLIVAPQWAGPDPMPAELPVLRGWLLDAMWCYDWRYPLVDPNDPADPGSWWFPPHRTDLVKADRFHPNQAGHVVIADRIEPHARTLLGL